MASILVVYGTTEGQLIMRREGGPTDSSRDDELTNWDDVAHFAQQFARLCVARPASP